jgi:hypothetical protein
MQPTRLTTICAALALALLGAGTAHADDAAFGLHIASHHTGERPDTRQPGWSARGESAPAYNNSNPGAYVRTDDGVVAGAYLNSYERWSVYAGREWSASLYGWKASITLALVTGYPKQSLMVGVMPTVSTPLLFDAYRVRLGFVPGVEKGASSSGNVFHLMVERQF